MGIKESQGRRRKVIEDHFKPLAFLFNLSPAFFSFVKRVNNHAIYFAFGIMRWDNRICEIVFYMFAIRILRFRQIGECARRGEDLIEAIDISGKMHDFYARFPKEIKDFIERASLDSATI